jgi:cyclophilin family peptidyl-prolyl cis-trans isomerase
MVLATVGCSAVPSDKRQRQREGQAVRREAMLVARKRQVRRNQLIVIGLVVVVIGGIAIFTSNSGKSTKVTTATSTPAGATPAKLTALPAGATISGDTPCPKADGSSPRTTKFAKAPTNCLDATKTYTAIFATNLGEIDVPLDTKVTPGTANNFVVLSRYHYYDGTAIHRTDPSIEIIQGGSPNTQDLADPGPGYKIKDEGAKFAYKPGDLVMARSSSPNSASAQFFFAVGPKTSSLDGQGTYVTFGHVSKGLDIVQKILSLHAAYPAGSPNAQFGGAPSQAVIISTITIKET